jgi:hypothetical protein
MTKALTPLYKEWLHCGSEEDIELMVKARIVTTETRARPSQQGRRAV